MLSYTKHKKNIGKAMSLFATTLTIASLGFFGNISALAEYKPELSRYEDTLSQTNPEALYNYNYENTSSEGATGYFEMSLSSLVGSKISEMIEVKSIIETTPIDYDTKKPAADAKTTDIKVSDAVYYDQDTLKIRISPQNECKVRPEGGCADGVIPASKPAKISIKVSLKSTASTTPTVIYGSGRIYFPNGYDVNQLGWKISINSADESKVEIPAIKDEMVDPNTLSANAMIGSQNQNAPAVTSTDQTNPTNDTDTKSNDKTKSDETTTSNVTPAQNSQDLNTNSVNSNRNTPQNNPNNTLIITVLGVTALAVAIGVGIYIVSRQKKAKNKL